MSEMKRFGKTLEISFLKANIKIVLKMKTKGSLHCVKSACIWSFSGSYSVQIQEHMNQENSKYRPFSHCEYREINKVCKNKTVSQIKTD